MPGIQQDMEFALKVEQNQRQAQQQVQQVPNSAPAPFVNCTKLMDLSGQVYQFKGTFCPVGYLAIY